MSKKGFTLIELISVIAIVAILFSAGTIFYMKISSSNEEKLRQANISEIEKASNDYGEDFIEDVKNQKTMFIKVSKLIDLAYLSKDFEEEDFAGIVRINVDNNIVNSEYFENYKELTLNITNGKAKNYDDELSEGVTKYFVNDTDYINFDINGNSGYGNPSINCGNSTIYGNTLSVTGLTEDTTCDLIYGNSYKIYMESNINEVQLANSAASRNIYDVDDCINFTSGTIVKFEKIGEDDIRIKGYANVINNNAWVLNNLKPSTKYYVSLKMKKVAGPGEGYTTAFDLAKRFFLHSGVSGYTSITIFNKNTTMNVGEEVTLTGNFTTPANLYDSAANYRILIYSERYTNSASQASFSTIELSDIRISEYENDNETFNGYKYISVSSIINNDKANLYDVDDCINFTSGTTQTFEKLGTGHIKIKTYGGNINNNNWVLNNLKPGTSYKVSAKIKKVLGPGEGYTTLVTYLKSFILFSGATGYSSVSIFSDYSVLNIGEEVTITSTFTTPINLYDSGADYRVLAYSEQWKNASNQISKSTIEIRDLSITEVENKYGYSHASCNNGAITSYNGSQLKISSITSDTICKVYYKKLYKWIRNEVNFNNQYEKHLCRKKYSYSTTTDSITSDHYNMAINNSNNKISYDKDTENNIINVSDIIAYKDYTFNNRTGLFTLRTPRINKVSYDALSEKYIYSHSFDYSCGESNYSNKYTLFNYGSNFYVAIAGKSCDSTACICNSCTTSSCSCNNCDGSSCTCSSSNCGNPLDIQIDTTHYRVVNYTDGAKSSCIYFGGLVSGNGTKQELCSYEDGYVVSDNYELISTKEDEKLIEASEDYSNIVCTDQNDYRYVLSNKQNIETIAGTNEVVTSVKKSSYPSKGYQCESNGKCYYYVLQK